MDGMRWNNVSKKNDHSILPLASNGKTSFTAFPATKTNTNSNTVLKAAKKN